MSLTNCNDECPIIDKCHVIGIGGISCGGKTSLTSALLEILRKIPNTDLHFINQDKYFLPEDSEKHVHLPELNHHNWDIPTSLDFDGLVNEMEEFLRKETQNGQQKILIVEGNLILNVQSVMEKCHQKFYLTLTEDLSYERRRARVYNPPDVPGYFHGCVWPMYLKHYQELKEFQSDIKYIDGSLPKNEIFDDVLAAITSELRKKNMI